MRLLVTRPQPDAERTAAALRRLGHRVDSAALLRIESIPGAELGRGPWSALVVTSANGLRAIGSHPRRAELMGLRVLAVGPRTAAAARAAGFLDVIAAGGNVQELVHQIRGSAPVEENESRDPLLYLAGQDRSADLAGELAAAGLIVATAVVYRAVKADRFSSAVVAALAAGQIDGVLHFSRRSAEAYIDRARAASLLDQALAPIHFCLSRQIAEPLTAAGAKTIRIAARPEETVLLELIGSGA